MVMRFRSGGEPSGRFHVGGLAGSGAPPHAAMAVPVEEQRDLERTTWFTSSLELREGLEVFELPDESIDRIVL
jgi:hypothetical protein